MAHKYLPQSHEVTTDSVSVGPSGNTPMHTAMILPTHKFLQGPEVMF